MKLPQDERVWLCGGAVAAVLIAAVSWFMVIGPERSSTASLGTQRDDVQLQNAFTQTKVGKLRLQAAGLGRLQAQLASALEALPKASGLPAFTRQLTAQATAAHVAVTGISIGAITAVSADGTAATTPSGTTMPATAGGGVFAIPVTVVSSGSLIDELAFLKAIQTLGPRRTLVTSTQFAPPASALTVPIDKATTVTAQLTVFSAP